MSKNKRLMLLRTKRRRRKVFQLDSADNFDWIKTPENRASEAAIHVRLMGLDSEPEEENSLVSKARKVKGHYRTVRGKQVWVRAHERKGGRKQKARETAMAVSPQVKQVWSTIAKVLMDEGNLAPRARRDSFGLMRAPTRPGEPLSPFGMIDTIHHLVKRDYPGVAPDDVWDALHAAKEAGLLEPVCPLYMSPQHYDPQEQDWYFKSIRQYMEWQYRFNPDPKTWATALRTTLLGSPERKDIPKRFSLPDGRPPGYVETEDREAPDVDWTIHPGLNERTHLLDNYLSAVSGEFYRRTAPPYECWATADSDTREEVKHTLVYEVSRMSGVAYATVNQIVSQWAVSSSDDDVRSLQIQMMAAEVFGIEPHPHVAERYERWIQEIGDDTMEDFPEAEDLPIGRPEIIKKVLRAMYVHTQGELRRVGLQPGDTVLLYRGTRRPGNEEDGSDYSVGEESRLMMNPLTSWSLGRTTANTFGSQVGPGEEYGYIFAIEVPIERIICTARTGMGCLTEGEIVLAGGEQKARLVDSYTMWEGDRVAMAHKYIEEYDEEN